MSTRRVIGIRREDKNEWERRVPIVPEHAARLIQEHNFEVQVQTSSTRAFTDEEFIRAGARIVENLAACDTVFAVKEIPADLFRKDGSYVFFSHVIKGQSYNMPMLRRMMELGCNLIDYEKMADEKNRRLVFFGNYAGLAGMIDTLWAFGQRLAWEETPNPFSSLRQALAYPSLEQAEAAIQEVGRRIASEGLPDELTPLVVGFAGYGNVSQGAQRILDNLPVEEIRAEELIDVMAHPERLEHRRHRVYKVVFREEHLVEPVSPAGRFELQDYYDHPEKYQSQFEDFLPCLGMLVNCIYWEERYPRLVTKEALKRLFRADDKPSLRVLGDITCDVGGSIECTVRVTDSGNPVFAYDPLTGNAEDGFAGRGPVVLAVDNLPCELPRESSTAFSSSLLPHVPAIVTANMTASFDVCNLPDAMKKALILHQGELTPGFFYLRDSLG